MNLIGLSIARPIAVVSAVLMLVMFGWVALQRIPIQMAPDVRRPLISVRTSWPGAAPAEVEREIVNRQEDALTGLVGVEEMSSTARYGSASVRLEFGVGHNMDRALFEVSSRLDQIDGYPAEANEPRLRGSTNEDDAIAWYAITRLPGNERDILTHGEFLVNVLQDRIARVNGVSDVGIFGDTEREMRIVIDPAKLARYGLTVGDVTARLRNANASITGGTIDEGKRRYIVRTEGDFSDVDQVRSIMLRGAGDGRAERGGRVTLSDIAKISIEHKDRRAKIRYNGEPAMLLNIAREQGSNVIEVMEEMDAAVTVLEAGLLRAEGLQIHPIYNETEYISSAIGLVRTNIAVGGILAALTLMLFLRSWRATLVVSLSIPVSVISTFVAMAMLGRSLNVISLAGIAFAVGMVVDAAIVVLENIYRLRQGGMSRAEAAYRGAAQVWGAVLVSALTTVMVFIPILVMELEVGQLFRDIAVAISVSVLLSLLVSITLIPALANRLLTDGSTPMMRIPGLDHAARAFVAMWIGFARIVARRKIVALGVVGAIVAGAAVFTAASLPPLDYLPTGNRNFAQAFVSAPEGYNFDAMTAIVDRMIDDTRPLWDPKLAAEATADGPPRIAKFYAVALEGRAFVGAVAEDASRVRDLLPVLSRPASAEPGTRASAFQPSLFGRGIGGGRSINIGISGPDMETLYQVGQDMFFRLNEVLPSADGHRVRAVPALTMGAPEVRVIPDRVRLADNGLSTRSLGQAVDAFNDGVRVAEITVDGQRMDLTLTGPRRQIGETQGIGGLPIVTRNSQILPVDSLADIVVTAGPTQIRRQDGVRSVSMRVSPSEAMPIEQAIQIIETEVLEEMRAGGLHPAVRFNVSGTADRLSETWDEIVVDLLLALVIVYLVMAVLFESFLYPLIIMLSVPVAAAGGLAGLTLLNVFVNQPLDMLTMLGFVILIGIVVNNAILLVHHTLYLIREEGLDADEAIARATQNRVRPIFMSTLTSVFGMMPLVLFPGAGSELYRGLGSVVLGGLSLSAVLTLAIVPPMMSISIGLRERRRGPPANVTPIHQTAE